MPSAVEYAKLKAAGLCTRCGKPADEGYTKCTSCRMDGVRDNAMAMDRIQLRTGSRQMLPEWKILEIEDQRKWNKENIQRRVI
jgi:hypothetical protein